VLERRLGLTSPALIAMEDAPGKPDPTGLFEVVDHLTKQHQLSLDLPVIYAGDTVADMQTLGHAETQRPQRRWIGVGVLPPHVTAIGGDYSQTYRDSLTQAGASVVVDAIAHLTAQTIQPLL
jgi:HAD superfamily phosphatase